MKSRKIQMLRVSRHDDVARSTSGERKVGTKRRDEREGENKIRRFVIQTQAQLLWTEPPFANKGGVNVSKQASAKLVCEGLNTVRPLLLDEGVGYPAHHKTGESTLHLRSRFFLGCRRRGIQAHLPLENTKRR